MGKVYVYTLSKHYFKRVHCYSIFLIRNLISSFLSIRQPQYQSDRDEHCFLAARLKVLILHFEFRMLLQRINVAPALIFRTDNCQSLNLISFKILGYFKMIYVTDYVAVNITIGKINYIL